MEKETVSWLVSTKVLVALCCIALTVGMGGALAVNLHLRHVEQHRFTEQFQKDQQLFNQQVAAAIQQLSKSK